MKNAVAIMVHTAPEQLQFLLEKLSSLNVSIYIHLDSKVRDGEKFHNIVSEYGGTILKERVDVKWAGFSMVEATLSLFRAAYDDGATRITLLSGNCLPIKAAKTIESSFSQNFDYISCSSRAVDQAHPFYNRFNKYWPMDSSVFNPKGTNISLVNERNYFEQFVENLPNTGLTERYSYFTGPNWISLRSSTFHSIDKAISEDEEFYKSFFYIRNPDESFFQSYIMKLVQQGVISKQEISPSLHYSDFSKEGRIKGLPKVLDETDFLEIKNSPKLFARKFDFEVSKELMIMLYDSLKE